MSSAHTYVLSTNSISSAGSQPATVIVIVDDQIRLGAALERLFRSVGLSAVAFASGSAALPMLHLLAPKLILLDLHMPTPDGVTVLRAIRQDKTLNDIPVLIHTSDFAATTRQWAADAGAQGYIVKGSVSCDEFLVQVRNALSGRECCPTRDGALFGFPAHQLSRPTSAT